MVAAITYPITFYAVRGGNRHTGTSPARNLAHIEVPRTVSFFGGHPAEAEAITGGPLCPECRRRMTLVPGTAMFPPQYECHGCGFQDGHGDFGGAA